MCVRMCVRIDVRLLTRVLTLLLSACTIWGCTPVSTSAHNPATQSTGSREAARAAVEPTVRIDSGVLQGAMADAQAAIRVYRGIPYAAPPTGARRFKPPQPPFSWSGIRSATDFGSACWQDFTGDAFVWSRGEFERSEDCLYLNLWTGASATDEKRPVMVWLHGGSHTGGYGHSKIFDGTELARRGVVLVSINYRLGPFGFLAHESLAAEDPNNSSGNYGLLDTIAALQWVKRNIATFGGDASNVTLFGQSAGAASVCYLMTSPLALGLFHKAIGQSAACMEQHAGDEDLNGRQRGAQLSESAGLTRASPAEQLRALSPEALLMAANQSGFSRGSRIVIDGWVIPEPPVQVFARGGQHRMPLLAGSMANEGHELIAVDETLTAAALDRRIRSLMGPAANALLTLYADELASSPA